MPPMHTQRATTRRPPTRPAVGVPICALVGLLIALAGSATFPGAAASSSYIDDYFLPTAKLALNKFQQSFTPPAQVAPNETSPTARPISQNGTSGVQVAEGRTINSEQNNGPTASAAIDKGHESPASGPSAGQSVSTTGRPLESAANELGSAHANPVQQQPDETTTILSSTESVSSDPTSTVISATNNEQTPSDQVQAASNGPPDDQDKQLEAKNAIQIDENSTAGTEVRLANEQSVVTPNGNLLAPASNELSEPTGGPSLAPATEQTNSASPARPAPPDEQTIRDTEQEAIAAVDASISFGGDLFGATLTDTCYDEYGNARFCEPEFENIAYEKQLEVSSECGSPASRFCTATYLQDQRNDQIRNCHICDAQHPKKRHPVAYLTDLNNPGAPTCWVSAPIGAANMSAAIQEPAAEAQAPLHRDNVTLTLHLGKSYEITYVSVQFCSLKPDSLAIYKSQDNGATWQPYQFYSSQCQRTYGLEQQSATAVHRRGLAGAGPASQVEATCSNGTSGSPGHQSSSQSPARVAFSTLEAAGRFLGGQPSDKSAALQDWMAASDLRIVLDRHQLSWIQSSLAYSHHHGANKTGAGWSPSSKQQQQAAGQAPEQAPAESSLTNPSDTYNYAISDLSVGGRCRCNGHASRCVHGRDGSLQCDCRHNTAGRDCERCASFHFDRPWQPANQFDANPCQPCQCNGHSRKCRFDPEIYQLSGRRSGGVCINCRDNTAGRHCHYCREGFTRDHSKPMSDKDACKLCDCHPVGSLGRVCNQTTGQCPCKEGVTGLECNRCAPGYQQSSSPSEPCIKLPDNNINYEPTIEVSSEAELNNPESNALDSAGPPNVLVASWPAPPVGRATDYPAKPDDDEPPPQAQPDSPGPPRYGPEAESGPDDQSHFGATRARAHSPRNHWLQQSDGATISHQYPPRLADGRQAPFNQHSNSYQARHSRPPTAASLAPDDLMDPAEPGQQQLGRATPNNHLEPTLGQDDDEFPPSPIGARQQPTQLVYMQRANTIYQHPKSRPQAGARSRPLQSLGGAGPRRLLVPAANPVANLDEPSDTELQDPESQSAAGLLTGARMATDDTPDFNQIVTQNDYYQPITNIRQPLHGSRHTSLARFNHQAQQQQQMVNFNSQTPSRYRPGPAVNFNEPPVNQPKAQPSENALACADCQQSTRRPTWRQFCHLDYAIKAYVVARYRADDWTRFEVEIQDIFKSPSGGLVTPVTPTSSISSRSAFGYQQMFNGYGDNLASYQSDDPNALNNNLQTNVATQTSKNNATSKLDTDSNRAIDRDQQQQQPLSSLPPIPTTMAPIHRLRVGSNQSIWIPTEDVACKCPRLKTKSTYLLMGLVDAKENSITSIQLDRHGVAIEWESGLQKKLIRYQRKQARKGC